MNKKELKARIEELERQQSLKDPAKKIRDRYAKRQDEYSRRYAVNFGDIAKLANAVNFKE